MDPADFGARNAGVARPAATGPRGIFVAPGMRAGHCGTMPYAAMAAALRRRTPTPCRAVRETNGMSGTVPAKSSRRIYIVDPDAAAGAALREALSALGYDARSTGSVASIIAAAPAKRIACVLVDASPGDPSAFALQQYLHERDADAGVVFMAAHADIAMAVTAMKRGAIDFLVKPLRMSELLPAVEAALAYGERKREARQHDAETATRLARLTPREREVFALVVQGKRNKAIAEALGSRESTVKVHRSRLMRKLGVKTLADLLGIGSRRDLPGPRMSPDRLADADLHTAARRPRRARTPAPPLRADSTP